MQNANKEFAEVGAQAGVVNQRYSIAPVTADFNNDGRPDIIHVNIAGRSKVFLSKPTNSKNGFLKVKLPDDVSSIGALVTVTLNDGSTLLKPFTSGEGLASDSSHVIVVGLGEKTATKVSVDFINKPDAVVQGSFRNDTVTIGADGL